MAFPDPEQYQDWRSYARALITALGSSEQQEAGTGSLAPPGYDPVWRDNVGDLYRGNTLNRPPSGTRLFQIDTAQIAAAAITEPTIEDFAVSSIKVKDAAIVAAKIGDLAVTTAKIDNLAVNSAKIAELIVSKLTSGTLDAVIDFNNGLLRFVIGNTMLLLGNSFGSENQFFLWFGAAVASPVLCSYANAQVYLTNTGDAFFKGTLLVGDFSTAKTTTDLAINAEISTGVIGSNGNLRTVTVSYQWAFYTLYPGPADAAAGTIAATVVLSRNGTDVATYNIAGDWTQTAAFGDTEPGNYTETMDDAFTFFDSAGGLSVEYSARLIARTLGPGPGGPGTPPPPETNTQMLSVVVGEET